MLEVFVEMFDVLVEILEVFASTPSCKTPEIPYTALGVTARFTVPSVAESCNRTIPVTAVVETNASIVTLPLAPPSVICNPVPTVKTRSSDKPALVARVTYSASVGAPSLPPPPLASAHLVVPSALDVST